MADGNDCPSCGVNIGVVAVFKAPVPNRIYCPHCGERLRYGGTGGLIAMAVFLTVVVPAAALAAYLTGFDRPGVAVGCALAVLAVGFVGLEVAFVLIVWYGDYTLESVNRPRGEWDDEAF